MALLTSSFGVGTGEKPVMGNQEEELDSDDELEEDARDELVGQAVSAQNGLWFVPKHVGPPGTCVQSVAV